MDRSVDSGPPSSRTVWQLGHRPALDGLRGVAIAMVVACHTGAPGLESLGGMGVTLFFVLSGFLITGVLSQEQAETGHVDLRAFYLRRVRRLAPALIALILAVIAAAALLGPWWFEWRDLPPVVLFYGNWVEALSPTPGVTLGALSITWSLAIEEQFYLLWPVLLIALPRRRRLLAVAVVLAGSSLLLRFGPLAGDTARLYYGTDTAAFALLLGAAAVLVRLEFGAARSQRWLIPVAGAVVVGCVLWAGTAQIPVGTPVVALASVAAVWGCTGPRRTPLLERPVLRWLGSRSYGLYLWHGPLLGAMREYYHLPWLVITLVGVPISFVLAELSFRFIEAPWRRRRTESSPTIS